MRWTCLSIYGKELEFSSPLEYYKSMLAEALELWLDGDLGSYV